MKKTKLIKKIAKAMGLKVKDIRLVTSDPVDMRGTPHVYGADITLDDIFGEENVAAAKAFTRVPIKSANPKSDARCALIDRAVHAMMATLDEQDEVRVDGLFIDELIDDITEALDRRKVANP